MRRVAIILIMVVSACAGVLCGALYYRYVNTNLEEVNEPPPIAVEKAEENNSDRSDDYIERINQQADHINGHIQWGVTMYEDDFRYTTQSEAVPSASVIKVFIMEYIYMHDGYDGVYLSDVIKGTSVRDLIFAMITRSDNAATNLLIDYIGMDDLNGYFKEQGYEDTEIQRKMLDVQAQNSGKDNYTSIADVMSFLDKLYTNKVEYPYSEMLDVMKKQQVRTKIPVRIPDGVSIANKTGELSNVENDIGIIFADRGDFAVAFLCSSLSNTKDARQFISDASYMLYNEVVNMNGGNK